MKLVSNTFLIPALVSSNKDRRLIVVMPAVLSSSIRMSSTPFSSSKKRRSGAITFMSKMVNKKYLTKQMSLKSLAAKQRKGLCG